jgi:hypothetical protein
MDNALNAMPAWQVIKEQEPALHQRILDQMAALQKAGEPEQQIIDTIQPQILHLQMSRLQNAPDANVVNYMTINMEQTAAIQKVSDDACFRFLYPMVKGGVNPMRMLDKDLMARRMQADADMMRAAYGKNRHTVTPAEREAAVEDVRPIMKRLPISTARTSSCCRCRRRRRAKRSSPAIWCRRCGRRCWRCRSRRRRGDSAGGV